MPQTTSLESLPFDEISERLKKQLEQLLKDNGLRRSTEEFVDDDLELVTTPSYCTPVSSYEDQAALEAAVKRTFEDLLRHARTKSHPPIFCDTNVDLACKDGILEFSAFAVFVKQK